MAIRIDTVGGRNALTARREPYWHKLANGQHLGYRCTDDGGNWIARAYDPATRKRVYQALGDLAGFAATDQFGAASKLAREWFNHLDDGGSAEVITVAQACERYVQRLRRKKGDTQADDAKHRFARYVNKDPIAGVQVNKLKKKHVEEWRDRLKATPAAVARRGKGAGRGKGKVVDSRPRAVSTVNRDMVAFRAALNLALADGKARSALPWREALKPDESHGRRDLYLDRDQRRTLLDHAPDDLRPFLTALAVLPLRPGALAALTVGDFDALHKTLTIGKDKAGEDRAIPLPDAVVTTLRESTRSKLPTAPIFHRWNGEPWNKDAWKGPVRAAAIAAKLPSGTCAYSLRHAAITDLVSAGLDLFTVAKLAGTSILMIERHYGKLQAERARKALDGLAL